MFDLLVFNNPLVVWFQLTTNGNHVSVCPHKVPRFLTEGSELLTAEQRTSVGFAQKQTPSSFWGQKVLLGDNPRKHGQTGRGSEGRKPTRVSYEPMGLLRAVGLRPEQNTSQSSPNHKWDSWGIYPLTPTHHQLRATPRAVDSQLLSVCGPPPGGQHASTAERVSVGGCRCVR